MENTDIVLVAGYGSSSPNTWAIRSTEWTGLLATHGINPNFIEFQSSQPPAGVWYRNDAELLLQKIVSARDWQDQKKSRRPCLLVAHCLGGLVVKQLVGKLGWASESRPELTAVARSISGVVLLGVLHRSTTEGGELNLLSECFKLTNHKLPKNTALPLEEAEQQLRLLTELFENVNQFQTGVRETSIQLDLDIAELCQLSSNPNEILYSVGTWVVDRMKRGLLAGRK
ncbi:hypothetical protein MGN70_003437 [Eutypa lata]|nr:hypothetical protein MGN70_003437 [Eutypa lata]